MDAGVKIFVSHSGLNLRFFGHGFEAMLSWFTMQKDTQIAPKKYVLALSLLCVTCLRKEPYAGILNVRICAGAGG